MDKETTISKKKLEIKNKFTGSIIFQSEKTTMGEAVAKAVSSGANLCEADLCKANLCKADLREADLCGANLCEADLCKANLREADLREADLCGANLCEADLCKANLRGANLLNAKFYGKTDNPKKLKKDQVPVFLEALGFVVKD